MNVAVIGASNDRRKFGNKAVRAYAARGHHVFPVNLTENTIEGLTVYSSMIDIPVALDATLVYLPPEKTILVLSEIARKGTKKLYLNPGSEDAAAVQRATALGLNPILACSIIAIGESPGNYGS